MKKLNDLGTRRNLLGVVAAGAASVPFALANRAAYAWGFNPAPGNHPGNGGGYGHGGSGGGYGGGGSGGGYGGGGSGGGYGGGGSGGGYGGGGSGGGGSGGGGGGCCCLLKGTRVATPSGERLIEDLQIGDELHTLSGRRIVRWIGYNKFTKDEGRPWLGTVMPVRLTRFAIDDETPHRDLYLSPEHCVFLNETLIPAKYLVNDVSIVRAAPPDMTAIEYYHIEFDTHEVIHAEGAPVESFLNEQNREFFSNFVQYVRLYGEEDQPRMTPFAPVLGYHNRRQKVTGLARSVVSNVIDVRDSIQVARDQLADRARAMRV